MYLNVFFTLGVDGLPFVLSSEAVYDKTSLSSLRVGQAVSRHGELLQTSFIQCFS